MTKRAIDVLLAVFGLLLAAPLFAVIALAVRLDSPGPAIFSQRRLGRGGEPFRLHKFRKFPGTWGSTGPGVTVAGDTRMTRTGRFLERTKLDELPQLWNILHGDMSFVGPRPESMRYADLFQGEFAEVLDYLPGIFGPNQIAFRNESQMYPPDQDPEVFYETELFPKKAKTDIAYFRNASVFADLAWIGHGLWVILVGTVDWRRTVGLHGPILAFDLLAIDGAWLLANLIRFEGLPTPSNWPIFISGFWLFPVVLLPLMILAGVYRHPVRHFCLTDAFRLGLSSTVGWILAYLVMVGLLHRNASFFLAPFGLLLSLSLMGAVRLWRREWWRKTAPDRRQGNRLRIAVYGAGRRGNALVSFIENGFGNAKVLGFLDDDDALLRGRTILGHRILGSERDLNTIHAVHSMDQLWTTFEPDIHKYHRLQQWCQTNTVKLVVVPATAPFNALCCRVPDRSSVQVERSESSEEHRGHGGQAAA